MAPIFLSTLADVGPRARSSFVFLRLKRMPASFLDEARSNDSAKFRICLAKPDSKQYPLPPQTTAQAVVLMALEEKKGMMSNAMASERPEMKSQERR